MKHRVSAYILGALLLICPVGLALETPVPVDDRFTVELVAQEPDIVTPTGLSVDESGRVWAIENNTHFRPKNYKGRPSDCIRIFSDFDTDGRARKIDTFADGFQNSMSLIVAPGGDVFFATRSEIYLLRDPQHTGAATEKKSLAKLETAGNYPHNGLSGLALGPDGLLYFGLGENLGQPYKLTGSDGTMLAGGGEGGNVYRCQRDGAHLEKIATGFWNPFGLGFDNYGRLFAVDNDPDGRPPCRLLYVMPGGDYGFRFRYGRSGLHPFQAWNGDLPGTLPMICASGEAPCCILACEFAGFPKEYQGDLIGNSWGDHLIQRFKLTPDGSTFKSTAETFINGSLEFRPVVIAPAPDNSLYISDWASTSYTINGKGRIWHVRLKTPANDGITASKLGDFDNNKISELLAHPTGSVRTAAAAVLVSKGDTGLEFLKKALENNPDPRARYAALHAMASDPHKRAPFVEIALQDKAPEVRAEAIRQLPDDAAGEQKRGAALADPAQLVRIEALRRLRDEASASHVLPMLDISDPFIYGACIDALSRLSHTPDLLAFAANASASGRIAVILILRLGTDPAAREALPRFLLDKDLEVRRAAVQWMGEENLSQFNAQLDEVGRGPMSRSLFDAYVASRALLSKAGKAETPEVLMAHVFADAAQPPSLRAMALRNLGIGNPAATVQKLKGLLNSPDEDLKTEAIHALALHPHPEAQPELRTLAADTTLPEDLRADVVAGLARSSPNSPETRSLLLGLLSNGTSTKLQREAIRSLRTATGQEGVQKALLTFCTKLQSQPPALRSELAEQIMFAVKTSGGATDDFKEIAALIDARPHDEAGWTAKIHAMQGDAAAGARLFYHARGPQCFICHLINNRGGNVGPELSNIGQTGAHDKIMISVLDPAREVAPEFVPWNIKLKDGRVIVGILQDEDINGVLTIAEATGQKTKIPPNKIERRATQKGTLMPDGLPELMTQQEFRDLLEFLGNCSRSAPIK